MERWHGMADVYEDMAKGCFNGSEKIGRGTFYRTISGLYRTHAAEVREIHR